MRLFCVVLEMTKATAQWIPTTAFLIPFVFSSILGLLACGEKPRTDAHIDFPIATHYPKRDGSRPDTHRKEPPGWGHFSASTTDPTAPTRDQVHRAARRWGEAGACPVDIYNHIDSLRSGVPRLQVVNNVLIGQSLWTFFVGPGWQKGESRPILILTCPPNEASNNGCVYGNDRGLELPEAVARAGKMGHPIVLAFVNRGGLESLGNHPDVMQSVGEGIVFAKQHLDIDPNRIVFAGQSLGGASALIWGANPLNLDYKTAGIFAFASPTNCATLLNLPRGTFPASGRLAAASLFADRTSVRAASESDMQILRDCLAGSQNPDSLAARSPIAHIDRYKNIYLALGWRTHDPLVGPQEGFDFVQALEKAAIPYYAEFTLGGPQGPSQGVKAAFEQFLRREFGLSSEELPRGRSWVRESFGNDKRTGTTIDDGSPIWTVFPQTTTASLDNAIYVGAPDGSDVYVMAEGVGDDPVTWYETDTRVEWDYVRVNLPVPPRPGRYKWTVVIGNAEMPNDSVLPSGAKRQSPDPETLVLDSVGGITRSSDPSDNARTFGHAWVWPY
ncbi:MAG: hypothetical protein O3B73_04750 [bacterium]|nr:hypothetical protein [bacterium]